MKAESKHNPQTQPYKCNLLMLFEAVPTLHHMTEQGVPSGPEGLFLGAALPHPCICTAGPEILHPKSAQLSATPDALLVKSLFQSWIVAPES
jgi:hypothetical protein